MNNNMVIETVDLTKNYILKGQNKVLTALNKVNVSIKEGEIFGLLGPNGAGKTTMIQILTTLKQPTSGEVYIDGASILKKPKQAKKKIALMLDNKMLYFRITGYDNLKFFCKIYKVQNYKEKILSIAEEFGLLKWLNEYVENFSSGMKMKLALCRTLLLNRQILFLDEPTLGLDVKSISFIVDKLKNLDATIFLTSHDMNVVEKLCNRIAFINKGKIIKIGNKDDIKSLMTDIIKVEVKCSDNEVKLISDLNQQNFIDEITEKDGSIFISLKKRDYYKELLSILSNYNIQKINEKELSLEDLFIKFS